MLWDNKGMSLIETTVAFFILVTITFTANTYMIGFFKANKSVKSISEATRIGNGVLDEIRSQDFDQITDNSIIVDDLYKCSWQVVPDPEIDMKKIYLTIEWPLETPESDRKKIELSTICAK